jgi:L-glyceraldehyde 3-phosphate reductase
MSLMTQFKADRYDTTPKDWFRRCGKSGLKLPAISLGCWHNFGGPGTDSGRHATEKAIHDNARAMLKAAFDHGITHFDLANNYGPPPGSAEERVGRILATDFKAHRDELLISSKAGWEMWPGPYGDLGTRKYLTASLDQSLKRLKLEYVDIFYHHRPDPDTPLEESLGAIDTAIRQGKVLYGGISSYDGALTRKAIEVCEREGFFKPIIHQPSYSMFDRWIEPDLLPVTGELGLGTIAFCPLAQGLLTDKYLKGIPSRSRVSSVSVFLNKGDINEGTMKKVRALDAIARARGQTLAQMALAWVVRPGAATSALIGASSPEQIIENCRALDKGGFSKDELDRIEAALKDQPPALE